MVFCSIKSSRTKFIIVKQIHTKKGGERMNNFSFQALAARYGLTEETAKHMYDVMRRYEDKIKLGEMITEPDFIEDMNMASGLQETQIRDILRALQQSAVWQPVVAELEKTWDAQEKGLFHKL
jgi:hypothetical protein